MHILIKKYKIS